MLNEIWNDAVILHNYALNELSDPRTRDLFLVSSPVKLAALLIFYVYFVKKLGPKLMEKREAFDLKNVLIIYNAFQVIANSWIFIEGWRHAWGGKYNLFCEPIDYSVTPHNMYVTTMVHNYFLIKLTDLLDTVFMVLRKKNGHISFLHVYHHTGMVLLAWGGTKYLAGGHGTFLGFINAFIHTIMYSYYLLSSLYPSMSRSWWKKYITQMQMIQFLMVAIHTTILLFQPNCTYPKFVVFLLVPQNFFMFILFLDFYIKTYKNKKIFQNKVQHNGKQS